MIGPPTRRCFGSTSTKARCSRTPPPTESGCDRTHAPGPVTLGFIAAAMVFATVWSRFQQRGPLEWLMTKATGLARHIP
ncbi:DUF418 domain-containing protein [Streptomyces sp. NPDC093064]|uniref:DUF418 domain-containing protein n=1 Tax=Streptomyces sp. NPDC093064 TaxID=3366020 RepID=UPI0037F3D758